MDVTVQRLLGWALKFESEWISGIAAELLSLLYLRGNETSAEGWALYVQLDTFAPCCVRIRLAEEMSACLDRQELKTAAEAKECQIRCQYIIDSMLTISEGRAPPDSNVRLVGPDGEDFYVTSQTPRLSAFFPPLRV